MNEFEDKHPRSPGTGQFARKTHGAAEISLAGPTADAEAVMPKILAALETITMEDANLIRAWKSAVSAREKSAAEVLAELETINAGGACAEHPGGQRYGNISAVSCFRCRIAMATEYALRPGPEPVPVGLSRSVPQEPWPGSQLDYDHDDDTGTTTSTTSMDGDEAFEAAVRHMLNVPADAPVTVTDTVTESGGYTKEYDHELTVSAGGRTATFDGLHSLMRALDRKDPDGPLEMALRLMRASDARRPLLSGPAAVYPRSSHEPFFAHITQVYAQGQDPTIRVMRLNGLEQYIQVSAIAAITETDQTEIYDESA